MVNGYFLMAPPLSAFPKTLGPKRGTRLHLWPKKTLLEMIHSGHPGHEECCVFLVLIIHHLRQGLTNFLKQKTFSYIMLARLERNHDALQQFILFWRHACDRHNDAVLWKAIILQHVPMFISYETPFCPKKGSSINRVRQRKSWK